MASHLLGVALACLIFSLVLGENRGGRVFRGAAALFALLGAPLLLLTFLHTWFRAWLHQSGSDMLADFFLFGVMSATAYGILRARRWWLDRRSVRRPDVVDFRKVGKNPADPLPPERFESSRRRP